MEFHDFPRFLAGLRRTLLRGVQNRAETVKSVLIPVVASIGGVLALALLCTDDSVSADTTRPAHILGGWSPSTPGFPKDHWEIVKIHDFSWIFHQHRSNSMKNRGF